MVYISFDEETDMEAQVFLAKTLAICLFLFPWVFLFARLGVWCPFEIPLGFDTSLDKTIVGPMLQAELGTKVAKPLARPEIQKAKAHEVLQ